MQAAHPRKERLRGSAHLQEARVKSRLSHMLPEMSVPKSAKPRASMPVHENVLKAPSTSFEAASRLSSSRTRTFLHAAIPAPTDCAPLRRIESISGWIKSSASTNRSYSPLAFSIPKLRADETPPFFLWKTRMRSSAEASSSQSRAEPSVEPSSTRIISRSRIVCD